MTFGPRTAVEHHQLSEGRMVRWSGSATCVEIGQSRPDSRNWPASRPVVLVAAGLDQEADPRLDRDLRVLAVRLALTSATICFLSRPSRSFKSVRVVTRYEPGWTITPRWTANQDDLVLRLVDLEIVVPGQFGIDRRSDRLGLASKCRAATSCLGVPIGGVRAPGGGVASIGGRPRAVPANRARWAGWAVRTSVCLADHPSDVPKGTRSGGCSPSGRAERNSWKAWEFVRRRLVARRRPSGCVGSVSLDRRTPRRFGRRVGDRVAGSSPSRGASRTGPMCRTGGDWFGESGRGSVVWSSRLDRVGIPGDVQHVRPDSTGPDERCSPDPPRAEDRSEGSRPAGLTLGRVLGNR